MKTHQFTQGSAEWHTHRLAHRNASDAPTMLGHGHKTRTELLHETYVGITAEVSNFVQKKIFDPGHAFEALARPLAEEILGKELYPVTGSIEIDGLKLSASFDGIDMMEDVGFEHKRLNATLKHDMFDGCTGTDLHEMYQIQMEQQCIVSGFKTVLFMASEWNGDELVEERHCIYTSNPELAAQIIAGWKQFEEDLANYVPQEPVQKATGRTPETLPALRIEVKGEVTTSNLNEYRDHALAVFAGINRELTTDQEFADAEKTVQWCASVEERIDAAKQHALSQMVTVDEIFSIMEEVKTEARRVRLELDRLVKSKKESIRNEIVLSRTSQFNAYIAQLDMAFKKPLMPQIALNIAEAIKGKRTVETLKDAADTELARAKIEAKDIANRITLNLATLEKHRELIVLFPDYRALVLKQADDLDAIITARIATHEASIAAAKEKAAREAEAAMLVESEMQAQAIAEQRRQSDIAAAELIVRQHTQARAEANAKAEEEQQAQVPVAQAQAPVEEDAGAMIRLGEINARIAPLSITADGLMQLGFPHAATDKSAKLYLESSFPKICNALIATITKAKAPEKSAA
jgi:predicted phage-related endonuclease